MQAAFEASLERLPGLQLGRIITKRCGELGLELTKAELEALTKHALAGNTAPLELGERPGLTEVTITFTEDDGEEISRLGKRLKAEMPEIVGKVAKDGARRLLRGIRKQWPELQAEHERERLEFEETISLIWGTALDGLDLLLATADTVGRQAGDVVRASRSHKRKALAAALDRLHVRGCQVGSEVLLLLRAGFADGALARWRTLHEICVVATVIKDHGADIAIRYLDHDLVDAQRAAEEYVRCHPKDAAKRANVQELAQTKAAYDAALLHYGAEFRWPYGWAAKHLGIEKPTFRDLEEAADAAQMRLRYKLASFGVHAGARGMTSSVADIFGEGPPGGASIAGLQEAGIEAAYSVVRLTSLLLGEPWSIDKIASMRVLVNLRNQTAKAFRDAGDAMSDATWVSEEELEAWEASVEASREAAEHVP